MNEKIRVAMLIQGYYPCLGGAERQLAALAPLLQARGIEVYVLTRRYRGLASFEMIDGVPVYRLPVPGPKPLASVTFTSAAVRLLRQLQPHVIHAYSLFSPATTAVAAHFLFGTPVAVKVLRGGSLGDVRRLKQKLFGAQRLSLFRKYVQAFTTISHEIDTELAEVDVPSERRPFIPNGVDTTRFFPVAPEEKGALRTTLRLSDGPTVLFVGRLAAEKRVDQLLSIWPAIRAAEPEALLCLLGTGAAEDRLRRDAPEGVRFAGGVDDVVPYLQAADLFVLPSVTEGLSNALLEALAAGLPTVATIVGGTTDVITHDDNGYLVPPGHPAALQEAILLLLHDANRRAQFARRGRVRIMRDYALPLTAERLCILYRQLLQPYAANGAIAKTRMPPKTMMRSDAMETSGSVTGLLGNDNSRSSTGKESSCVK